jgi:hypothetical protein
MGGGNEQALLLERAKATPSQQKKWIGASTFTPFDVAYYQTMKSSGGWSFYVRQLNFQAEPFKGVQLEYGGIGFNRGVATEMTTYDNDGYLAGESISIKRPKNFYFDEASVTYGYVGDLFTPNFFARGQRLAHANYHQFLVRKHFGKRVDTSFDYSWQNAAQVLHEDALVNVKQSRVLDSVRIEVYQRLNGIYYPNVPHIVRFYRTGGNGYGFTLAKRIKRAELEGGLMSYDEQSVAMTQVGILGVSGMSTNGDQYGLGHRYFIRPTIKLTSSMDLVGYYTHLYGDQSDPTQSIWNKQNLQLGLVFNIKKALFSEHKAN